MKIFKTNRFSHSIAETRSRGVGGTTLIEMLVAIAVTIIMMAVAGVVFKNAIDASGSATATGEMMATARGIIQQLERDFKGLRTDLPMAIIFEEGVYRHDRIVFFADGDFQVPYSGAPSGNLARIFYGQMIDGNGGYSALARRFKIMTALSLTPVIRGINVSLNLAPDPSIGAWSNIRLWPEDYDYQLFEGATAADWKNISSLASASISGFPDNFKKYYFNDQYNASYRATESFVRRPVAGNLIGDELQRLYMAGYIGEFKIEVPVGSGPGYGTGNTWSAPIYDQYFSVLIPRAFYWNVDDMDGTTNLTRIDKVPVNPYSYTEWYGVVDRDSGGNQVVFWPEALKFTFTLYEKNVKYYPDGQTFSYIVKLKQP